LKFVLALITAYLLTGIIYVWRKLVATDYVHVPLFVVRYRAKGDVSGLIAATLGWALAALINREFGYWLVFVLLLATIDLCISSI
jgi:hypothetical protein